MEHRVGTHSAWVHRSGAHGCCTAQGMHSAGVKHADRMCAQCIISQRMVAQGRKGRGRTLMDAQRLVATQLRGAQHRVRVGPRRRTAQGRTAQGRGRAQGHTRARPDCMVNSKRGKIKNGDVSYTWASVGKIYCRTYLFQTQIYMIDPAYYAFNVECAFVSRGCHDRPDPRDPRMIFRIHPRDTSHTTIPRPRRVMHARDDHAGRAAVCGRHSQAPSPRLDLRRRTAAPSAWSSRSRACITRRGLWSLEGVFSPLSR